MDRLSDILSQKNSTAPKASTASESDTPELSVSPQFQAEALRVLILNMKKDLDQMLRVLEGSTLGVISPREETTSKAEAPQKVEQVIEGVFNGQKMIDDEGNTYDVPSNYASKSKLVEGDMMKLTIGKQGNFMYKQIGPIERQRIRGVLYYNEAESQWSVIGATGKSYKVLTASVTFYKGKAKDEVIALIPQNGHSEWAAVEHIISPSA